LAVETYTGRLTAGVLFGVGGGAAAAFAGVETDKVRGVVAIAAGSRVLDDAAAGDGAASTGGLTAVNMAVAAPPSLSGDVKGWARLEMAGIGVARYDDKSAGDTDSTRLPTLFADNILRMF
jgi:hypothetical protein